MVAVVVGVEAGGDERVKLDGFAVDEFRLEGLNGETVERRSAVKEDVATLNDFIEGVPDDGFAGFNHARIGANVVGVFMADEPANHERLKEFECHLLREATFVGFQLWADNDDGAAGVVNALTKKVLAETTLFTFEEVREGFELATAVLSGVRER